MLISYSVQVKGDDKFQMAEYRSEIKQGNSSFHSLRKVLESCSWNTLQFCQLLTVDTWACASKHCYTIKSQEVTQEVQEGFSLATTAEIEKSTPPLLLVVGRACATESHFCSSRKSHSGRTARSWQMLEAYPQHPRLWLWGKKCTKKCKVCQEIAAFILSLFIRFFS